MGNVPGKTNARIGIVLRAFIIGKANVIKGKIALSDMPIHQKHQEQQPPQKNQKRAEMKLNPTNPKMKRKVMEK